MSVDSYLRDYSRSRKPSALARYTDLILVFGIVAIVAIMILPLPGRLIDALIAANMAMGLILILVSIYISSPTEFAVFPSVLLISTLFRLSLAIATTRMILLEGHAGHIIDAFGRMVAGGSVVVGLVVFLIITVVQFIVIAKGAERVAEVAARFSLDAMPGKQLSIDSDLRAGIIDKVEARKRRRNLEQESKLYGSMDGAMKFVKGDAIAGIVIIIINLIGGLAIGVMQLGMDFSAAMTKYSILTIGDGLVSQIPALLGAIAAGLIVTRTSDPEQEKDLGDAIRQQLVAKPRVLLVGGTVSVLMGFVPGFPLVAFALVGGSLIAVGVFATPWMKEKAERYVRPARSLVDKRPVEEAPIALANAKAEQPMVDLLLEVNGQAASGLPARALAIELDQVRRDLHMRLGVSLPEIAVHSMVSDKASSWRLLAYEVAIAGAELSPDRPTEIGPLVREALLKNCDLFLGAQEVSNMLNKASDHYPDLVKEIMRVLPVSRLAEIMKNLVKEQIPIRDLRSLLEGLIDAGEREKDVLALTEFSRIALRRHVCNRYAPNQTLTAILIPAELEAKVRESIRIVGGAQQLALDPAISQQLVAAVSNEVTRTGIKTVLTAVDIRSHIRRLIESELFDVGVVSFHELLPNIRLDIAGRVEVDLQLGGPAPGGLQ